MVEFDVLGILRCQGDFPVITFDVTNVSESSDWTIAVLIEAECCQLLCFAREG